MPIKIIAQIVATVSFFAIFPFSTTFKKYDVTTVAKIIMLSDYYFL